MSEFNDNYPQYELMAHHSEAEGVIKRKKLWSVFWIMLGITIAELIIGTYAERMGWLTATRQSTLGLKLVYIALTIFKAAFIVLSFMHLGDEKKSLKWVILGPYIAFILYLAFMAAIGEGSYQQHRRMDVDQNVVKQAAEMKQPGGGAHQEEPATQK